VIKKEKKRVSKFSKTTKGGGGGEEEERRRGRDEILRPAKLGRKTQLGRGSGVGGEADNRSSQERLPLRVQKGGRQKKKEKKRGGRYFFHVGQNGKN